jgi:hypothetical protein
MSVESITTVEATIAPIAPISPTIVPTIVPIEKAAVPAPKTPSPKDKGVKIPNMYDLHSNRSVKAIEMAILKAQEAAQEVDRKSGKKKRYSKIGMLRIIMSGKDETNLAVLVVDQNTYEAIVAAGYCQGGKNSRFMRVEPFFLRPSALFREGQTSSLFVPAPGTVKDDDVKACEAIDVKMTMAAKWDIIPEGSWNTYPTLASRESGTIKSGVYVGFDDTVPIEQIAAVRILLNDTYWPESVVGEGEEVPTFRCYWAHERRPYKKADGESLGKGEEKVPRVPRSPKATKAAKADDPEQKQKEAILNMAKHAVPVKKAPTIPTSAQPVLSTVD